jgi:glyoxylase-like metal-dependent hydrolase (beta-lactamase superfamily II)
MTTSASSGQRAAQPGAGAERLADGVWLLRGSPRYAFNVYVMGDALVDAATRHAAKRLLSQVQGVPLSAHVLTHGHMDHTGSSHELCEALRLPLLCGAGDRAVVESGDLGRDDAPLFMRVQHRLMAGQGHQVSRTLGEGDEVAGFAVLEVPGHSPGHLAFWRERDRVLILGDVLFGLNPATGRRDLRLPPAVFTPDPAENLRSAQRLAELGPELVCFGHGPPQRDGRAFREFVASATF